MLPLCSFSFYYPNTTMQITLVPQTELTPTLDDEKVDAIDLLTVVMSARRIHDDTADRGWEAGMVVVSKQMKWPARKTMAVQARLHALCDAISAEKIPDMTVAMLKEDMRRSLPLLTAAASARLHSDGKTYYLNPKVLLVRAGIGGLHTPGQDICAATLH